MAGALSNYSESHALDLLITGTSYVGLFLDERGETPSTEATNEVCPGYSRKPVTHNPASGGVKTSNSDVVWTATSAWMTVRYVGVWDSETGGNLLYWSEIGVDSEDDKTLGKDDTLTVYSGQLSTTIKESTS